MRDEPEPVYNLEGESAYCYRVGEQELLVHNTSAGPDPIREADGEAAVAAIRQQFGIAATQNIAYAEVATDTYQDEPIGVSGSDSPAGTVAVPTSRLFDTFDTPPGFYRGNDSEVKLLEAMARAIQPNAQKGQCYPQRTGSIRLYSHFTLCPSCDGVIAAFRAMFPSIDFSYSDGA